MKPLHEQATSSYRDEDDAILEKAFGPLRALVRASGPGRFFGNYELLKVIGVGGQGVVYRARQVHVGKVVALKLVNAADRRRSLRELGLASDLEHESLVRVYHVGEHDGRLYYTMQLAERGSLKDTIEAHRLRAATDGAALAADHRRLAGFMARIARAVAFLHDHNVIHRDLKPANVLIDANGEPLVTDLGLAWRRNAASKGEGEEGFADVEKTCVGGTMLYMAPEQMTESVPTEAGDIYSLGVILFELLTGRRPFEGANAEEIQAKVCGEEPPPSPFSLNPDIGAGSDLELVCLQCLARDPKNRYPTAEALAKDLEAVRNGEPTSHRKRHWLVQIVEDTYRVVSASPPVSRPELMRWSWVDLADAVLIAAFHGSVYALAATGAWVGWVWLALLAFQVLWWGMFLQFLLGAPVLPRERHLIFIWAVVYLAEVVLLLGHCPPLPGVSAAAVLPLYPAWVAITGVAFFVIGHNWWGRYHLVALAHFACAAVMPLDLTIAPLVYVVLNAVCMTWQGFEHRQKAAQTGIPIR